SYRGANRLFRVRLRAPFTSASLQIAAASMAQRLRRSAVAIGSRRRRVGDVLGVLLVEAQLLGELLVQRGPDAQAESGDDGAQEDLHPQSGASPAGADRHQRSIAPRTSSTPGMRVDRPRSSKRNSGITAASSAWRTRTKPDGRGVPNCCL